MNKPNWLIDHATQAYKLHSVWLSALFAFAGAAYATVQECWPALSPSAQEILKGLAPEWIKHWWPVLAFILVIAARFKKQPNAMPPQQVVPPPQPVLRPEVPALDPARAAQLKAQADAEKPA